MTFSTTWFTETGRLTSHRATAAFQPRGPCLWLPSGPIPSITFMLMTLKMILIIPRSWGGCRGRPWFDPPIMRPILLSASPGVTGSRQSGPQAGRWRCRRRPWFGSPILRVILLILGPSWCRRRGPFQGPLLTTRFTVFLRSVTVGKMFVPILVLLLIRRLRVKIIIRPIILGCWRFGTSISLFMKLRASRRTKRAYFSFQGRRRPKILPDLLMTLPPVPGPSVIRPF